MAIEVTGEEAVRIIHAIRNIVTQKDMSVFKKYWQIIGIMLLYNLIKRTDESQSTVEIINDYNEVVEEIV